MKPSISHATVAAVCLTASLAVAQDAENQPIQSMRIDMDATRPAGNGCRYQVAVHGVIVPAKAQSSAKAKTEPMVEPTIDVAAEVACPSSAVVKITDTAMATGPLTRSDLEHALERRASVVAESAGKRCVYLPDLTLEGQKLQLASVGYTCVAPPKPK